MCVWGEKNSRSHCVWNEESERRVESEGRGKKCQYSGQYVCV